MGHPQSGRCLIQQSSLKGASTVNDLWAEHGAWCKDHPACQTGHPQSGRSSMRQSSAKGISTVYELWVVHGAGPV